MIKGKQIFCIALFLPCLAGATSFESLFYNNRAVKDLMRKNPVMGQRQLLESLKHDPDNFVARLNLGISFVQLEDYEKALREFRLVEESPKADAEAKFAARFNVARAYHLMKNVPLALEFYQNALAIKKDSLEVKANIEMLLQEQSGQGQGEGKNEKPQPDPNSQGQNDSPQQPEQNQKPEGEAPNELSKSDVEKIMQELKDQEQRIRNLEFGNKAKEADSGKNW